MIEQLHSARSKTRSQAILLMYGAVRCLAGMGILKERIFNALTTFVTLKMHDIEMPQNVKDRLLKLWKTLEVADPKGQEGRWQATINVMTDEELHECSMEIVDIFDTICRYQKPFE